MGSRTLVEWTDSTWNPLRGQRGMWWCSKIRPGCVNCYAERWTAFRGGPDAQPYRFGADAFQIHEETLTQPLRWARPRRVFVCSMTDLFHRDVPDEYIRRIFDVMAQAPQHTFQVLTKHGMGRWVRDVSRAVELAPSLPWPSNVWMGASVESGRYAWVADRLRSIPAAVRWISAEPLLGSLAGIDLAGIDWLVGGGESGPGFRPVSVEHAREARDLCAAAGVPFLWKQWGGANKKRSGRLLDGVLHDSYPASRAA